MTWSGLHYTKLLRTWLCASVFYQEHDTMVDKHILGSGVAGADTEESTAKKSHAVCFHSFFFSGSGSGRQSRPWKHEAREVAIWQVVVPEVEFPWLSETW